MKARIGLSIAMFIVTFVLSACIDLVITDLGVNVGENLRLASITTAIVFLVDLFFSKKLDE